MTGPAFMRPYGPHVGHVIKMNDETRNGTPVAVTDDLELFAPVKPSTIYMVRIVIFITAGFASSVWRPACTSAVDLAALFTHRPIASDATDFWITASVGAHYGDAIDTTRFNAPTNLQLTNAGARHLTGVVQTGSGGGTFSVQWGGGNGSRTMKAGSYLYLREALAY